MEYLDVEGIAASIKAEDLDCTERSIPFHHGMVKLFYIMQLTDRTALTENVLKPLILHCSSAKKGDRRADDG